MQVEKLYSGDQDGAVAEDMKKMDHTGGSNVLGACVACFTFLSCLVCHTFDLPRAGYLMLHIVAWLQSYHADHAIRCRSVDVEVKQYHRPDCNAFDVFGRVLSGTVFRGDRVKILGTWAQRCFWDRHGSHGMVRKSGAQ